MPAVSRLAFVATGVSSALVGCAGTRSGEGVGDGDTTTTVADDHPAADHRGHRSPGRRRRDAAGRLALTSPAFEDGASIPGEDGRRARDADPPLRVAGVPGDAAALVAVVDDSDAVEPRDASGSTGWSGTSTRRVGRCPGTGTATGRSR